MAKLFKRSSQPQNRLANLDELGKLRRPGQSFIGAPTGEQPGFILPYGKTMRNPEQAGYQAKAPAQLEIPPVEELPVEEFTPPPVEQQQPLQQQPQGSYQTADQFFQSLTQAANNPQVQQAYNEGIASVPGGRILTKSGQVLGGNDNYPIASAPGGVIMKDGTFIQVDPSLAGYMTGLPSLSQLLFGRQQTVTQDYGNINPMEPTAGNVNLGTDFRTRDLSNKQFHLPVSAEVVEILQDDGISNPYQSATKGYGNSVLLRLPTGEMFRLSHLSELGNLQVGQTVMPGSYIGTAGQTGNTAGEHLDFEYYNREGRIDDPANFKVSPELFQKTSQPQQQMASVPQNQPQMMSSPAQQPQAQPQVAPQPPQGIISTAQNIGTGIAQAAQPQSPQRQAVGQGIAQAGKAIGAPEVYASEVASGQMTPGQGASFALEQNLPKTRIDTGFSEALRGDFAGAKKNFEDTKSRIMARVSEVPGQLASAIAPPAFAADGTEGSLQKFTQSLGQNAKGAAQSAGQYINDKTQPAQQFFGQLADKTGDVVSQAGAGLEKLKQGISGGQNSNLFSRPASSDLDLKKAVGTPGISDLVGLLNPQQAQGRTQNDIRDPFFKSGQSQQFSSYLNPGAEETGALGLGTFNDKFYQNQSNVSNVFGGTNLNTQAQGKYQEYVAEEARKAEEARRAEEARKAAEEAARRASEPRPTLDDYLRRGKTAAQYYAETGQDPALANRPSGGGGGGGGGGGAGGSAPAPTSLFSVVSNLFKRPTYGATKVGSKGATSSYGGGGGGGGGGGAG